MSPNLDIEMVPIIVYIANLVETVIANVKETDKISMLAFDLKLTDRWAFILRETSVLRMCNCHHA